MTRRRRRLLALLVLIGLAAVGASTWFAEPGPPDLGPHFVALPYLQLGDAPDAADRLDLLWLGVDQDADWSVEVQTAPDGPWVAQAPPTSRRVAVEKAPRHRIYRATLAGLTPGAEFRYRVRRDGTEVFRATGRARRPAGAAHRFVAFGDCGEGTSAQRAVAYQAWRARPDFVLIPGDIAYTRGRVTDYLAKFFPAYSAEAPSPRRGAPLLRAVPFVAAPGNHDLVWRDLDQTPDAMAYFYYWAQPLNGPTGETDPARLPTVTGSADRQRAFREIAGAAYPRMANFSFDYAGAHWAVLDANAYANLGGPAVRDWLARDLAAARHADWRFVALHHPPFHSSKAHADDQRARLLVDVFERGQVDLVICGHVHNYQRTYPLTFVADAPTGKGGAVGGRWVLDRAFDGDTRTTPQGIIYLITGAGGARLYDSRQHGDTASWQEFTSRFIADRHSLTVVDVEPRRLTVRQVSDRGDELDRFVVTRGADGTMNPADPTTPPTGAD